MTKNDYILTAENVHKTYTMGTNPVHVLKGIDMQVKPGEFVAIVGSSGSGKSTLLHILGALDKPDKGTVKFFGDNISHFNTRRVNEYRNKHVGFVFQFYHLLDELNVLENVFLPAMTSKSTIGWFMTRSQVKQRAKSLLSKLSLKNRIKHKPYQLSGGERQRAAIGRALMNDPQLLLADEPTGNLDSKTGEGIMKVFEELNKQGQTIVMVTHDMRVAQRANRIIELIDGKIK